MLFAVHRELAGVQAKLERFICFGDAFRTISDYPCIGIGLGVVNANRIANARVDDSFGPEVVERHEV